MRDDEFYTRAKAALRARAAEPKKPGTPTFRTVGSILSSMSIEQMVMLETIRQNGAFLTIDRLAEHLRRERDAVCKDLAVLVTRSLVEVRKVRRPDYRKYPDSDSRAHEMLCISAIKAPSAKRR